MSQDRPLVVTVDAQAVEHLVRFCREQGRNKLFLVADPNSYKAQGEAVAGALKAQGFDVQINIVGFALDDDALRAQFADWAELGGGAYYDATNAAELSQAIAKVAQAPFKVLDSAGNVVATGTVGGDPIDLPPGTYTVDVLTDPEQTIDQVVVEEDKPTVVQLTGT